MQNPHSRPFEDVLSEFRSSQNGLSMRDASERLQQYGSNTLSSGHKRTALDILISQFKNFIFFLLLGAAGLSFFIGHVEDSIAILFAVALSTAFGFFLEYKADQSLRALQNLTQPQCKVIRDGNTLQTDSSHLVVGDVIVVEEGDKVPADARIIESYDLEANESQLTGESQVVKKHKFPVAEDAPISERTCMIYSGSFITKGKGIAVVCATANASELGKIASALKDVEAEATVLQQSLDDMGKKVSFLSIGIVFFFLAIGVYQGREWTELFVLSISLVVAAVPEGLITVLTIILAIGVRTMAKNNALVRKLNCVETLGTATMIIVDKTGTVTEGKMSLTSVYENGRVKKVEELDSRDVLINYAVLCNSAQYSEEGFVGDEMDKSILFAANSIGINVKALIDLSPLAFFPLTSQNKRMSFIYALHGKQIAVIKGAPEVLLSHCTDYNEDAKEKRLSSEKRAEFEHVLDTLVSDGKRVLALTYKYVESTKENELKESLTFLGFLIFSDPVRTQASQTVSLAKTAGISMMMLTGDNLKTAAFIGREIGLIKDPKEAAEWKSLEHLSEEKLVEHLKSLKIIARSTPLSKLKVVELLIKQGEIVAVTGDGVNDAPALKKAHVGVVMGSGTEVSKEAANLVLLDDNISTLINAIKYGRVVFDNIINFIRFQFTTNIATLILFFLSFFGGLPYLLTPIQILFLNLFMDGPPALALGFEKESRDVLKEKPRKERNIMSRNLLASIFVSSIWMVAVTIGVYFHFVGTGLELTAAFCTFVFLQLFNSLNCRFSSSPFWHKPLNNPYIFAAFFIMAGILLIILQIPELQGVFETTALSLEALGIVIGAASSILFLEEFKKRLLKGITQY